MRKKGRDWMEWGRWSREVDQEQGYIEEARVVEVRKRMGEDGKGYSMRVGYSVRVGRDGRES